MLLRRSSSSIERKISGLRQFVALLGIYALMIGLPTVLTIMTHHLSVLMGG